MKAYYNNGGQEYTHQIKNVGFWSEQKHIKSAPTPELIKQFLTSIAWDEYATITENGYLYATFTPNFCGGEKLVNLIVLDNQILYSRYAGSKFEHQINERIINRAAGKIVTGGSTN